MISKVSSYTPAMRCSHTHFGRCLVVTLIAMLISATTACADAQQQHNQPDAGSTFWRAWLDSPGGQLRFVLETQLDVDGEPDRAWIHNGEERIAIPTVCADGEMLLLRFNHYDSEISAAFTASQSGLQGAWTKTGSSGAITKMAFHARSQDWLLSNAHDDAASAGENEHLKAFREQRWTVDFESSDDPAVGVFVVHGAQPDETENATGIAHGTFMTTTGDYRYLAGRLEKDQLFLSVFDGAHAFLFKARVQKDGTLAGDFWSRDAWRETWTAHPDADAALPNAFTQTTWAGASADDATADLEQMVFKDMNGKLRSVAEFKQPDRPMLIKVFGSWCPNCHDAAKYLVELDQKYQQRGLTILGLAFELTGDFERDAGQVRIFKTTHGIEFPLLLAGLSDKEKATKSLAVLDKVRSFPTTIFIDGDGAIRSIHTGYTGPATGAAHDEMRAEYERLIEEMLAE